MRQRVPVRAVLALVLVASLSACATTIDGKAVKAPHDITADGADLAVLNPGNYPRGPRPPLGLANSENFGTVLEGHRMANNIAGPWDIDPALKTPQPLNTLTMQRHNGIAANLPDPGQDIVSAHHLLAGFSTARNSSDTKKSLIIMVLRFPDPGSAADTAKQLADVGVGDTPVRPFDIPRYPDAIGRTYDEPQSGGLPQSGGHATEGYLPHGPYLLYAWARTADSPDASAALVATTYDQEIPRIDAFVPTDPGALATLPMDPVGFLNRVVPADQDASDVNFGGYQPYAALHFQDDPSQVASDFNAAGVDAVATLRTTVYRARDAAGAQHLLDSAIAWSTSRPGAKPAPGVDGLPSAKCFEYTQPDVSQTPRFGCVGTAGRHQFEAWSEQGPDVRQQTASQYLMLTQD